MEIWTPLALTGDMYDISNLGGIRSWISPWKDEDRAPEPRILNPALTSRGYLRANLSVPHGERRKIVAWMLHRLVLEGFVGPMPKGMMVRHLNGVKTDNRLENLVYGTSKENGEDRVLHGTTCRGDKNVMSKLTDDQVMFILESDLPSRKVAPLVGVTHGHVRKIRRGEIRGYARC